MKTRADMQHELYSKFKELENCKIYAIKRAFRKFYNIPLEIDDLEFIAWKAFLEVEDKFLKQKHSKTYENFYRDCLYWRAKDYCVKYMSNKHKACNQAQLMDWSTDYKSYVDETPEEKLLDRLAVRAYIDMNKHNEKGVVAKCFMYDFSIQAICEEINYSKSKVYRVIEEVRKDLSKILIEPN